MVLDIESLVLEGDAVSGSREMRSVVLVRDAVSGSRDEVSGSRERCSQWF